MARAANTAGRSGVAIVTVALCCMGLSSARSDSPNSDAKAAQETSGQWRFQRLLVPADRPDEWPRDKSQRYLPMAADDFEERIAKLRVTSQTAEPSTAQLVRAEYEATLQGNDLADGRATWEFAQDGSERSLVVFSRCQLPMANFHWIAPTARGPGAGNAPSPPNTDRAIVGNDQAGRLVAIVDRSGRMQGEWSLHGQAGQNRATTFQFNLAECPINVLRLTLPKDKIPDVMNAVISAGDERQGYRLWKIEPGGNQQFSLRIVHRTPANSPAALIISRPKFTYDYSPRGLELTADLHLDIIGAPISQIRLRVDNPLSVVRASHQEASIAIAAGEEAKSDQNSENSQTTSRQIVLDLPQPIYGYGQIVQVIAIAPIPWGTKSRLPLVRVEDAVWQEANSSLVIQPPLVAQDLSTQDCHQTSYEKISAAERPQAEEDQHGDTQSAALPTPEGAKIGIQWFTAEPKIDVTISRRHGQLCVLQGTSVSLRASEATARCDVELISDEERSSLEAEIPQQWIIENVESSPAGAIADWSKQSLRGRPGRLSVRLNSPLAPNRSLHLQITGRRLRAPWGDTLRADELSLLTILDSTHQRRLVQLQTSEAFQLQLHGDAALTRLDPATLSVDDEAVLGESPSGLLFVDDIHASALGVSLIAKAPKLDADIRVEAKVGDDTLSESYRFLLIPHGRDVTHLRVRFSQLRPEPLLWSVEGAPANAVTARRLSESEVAASGLAASEIWEVSLATGHLGPFVVDATRSTSFHDDAPIALASVLDAETQRGTVHVSALGRSLPEVRTRRLSAVPVDPPMAGQIATSLAALRYDPEEDALLSVEPPLVIAPRDDASTAKGAWIWHATLESSYFRQDARHTLTCEIENAGRSRIQIQPPAGAKLNSATVDHQPVSIASAAGEPWKLPLPTGARFTTIVLDWTDDQASQATISQHAAPWPIADIPLLRSQWVVRVRPGTTLVDAEFGGTNIIPTPWIARFIAPVLGLFGSSHTKASSHSDAADNAINRDGSPTGNQWIVHQLDSHSDSVTTICLVDEKAMFAWSWAILLMAIAIGCWAARRSAATNLVLISLATAATLVAPPAYVPLTAAIWLGLLAGNLYELLMRNLPRVASHSTSQSSFFHSPKDLAATASAVVLVVIPFWQCNLRADDSDHSSNTNLSPPLQALVPVDDQGKPTGGLYFLPESLRDRLLRITSTLDSKPQFIVTSADYRVSDNGRGAHDDIIAGDWHATLNVESLVDHVTLRLPLGFDGATLVPDSIRLNDSPVAFRADGQEQTLLIELERLGSHRIDLDFRPLLRQGSFDFAVPKVAAAQIELNRRSPDNWRAENMLGNNSWLGPAGRVIVRPINSTGAADQSTGAAIAKFDVDQLLAVTARPDFVVADLQFQVRVESTPLRHVRLKADQRWQPLTPADGTLIASITATDDANDFLIEFSKPLVGEATVGLSLMLKDSSGIGRFGIPAFHIDGADHIRQRCALTVAPVLKKNFSPPPGSTTIAPAAFSALWKSEIKNGSAPPKPQVAWQPASETAEWEFATWLPNPSLEAKYQLAATASLKQLLLRTLADVKINGDAAPLALQLAIPPDFEIDEASIRQRGEPIQCHWMRSSPDRVTIFLHSPPAKEFQISLDGHVELRSSGVASLPAIRLENAQSSGASALVFRRPEVSVELEEAAGSSIAASAQWKISLAEARQSGLIDPPAEADERLIAVLNNPQNLPSARLKIEPNQPQILAQQLTTLNRSADAWSASVDFDLQIDRGLVDSLRIDLPPNWIGPFQLSPAMPYSIDEVIGETRRQLVLLPDRPLGPQGDDAQTAHSNAARTSSLHLNITGPLTIPTGQRPSVPDVRLSRAVSQNRFLMVPRRLDNQLLAWDIRSLVPTRTLPRALADFAPNRSPYWLYQSVGETCRASLRSGGGNREKPRVHLADISVSLGNDGHLVGVAEFDFEAQGASGCELELPSDSQLVQARLDTTPAQLVRSGESRWSVWLGESNLPRHLEVIYVGRTTELPGDNRRILAPSLVGLPVEQTLWMISVPETSLNPALSDPSMAITPLKHAATRFDAIATLSDSAAGLLPDESAADLTPWYALWIERIATCRAALSDSLQSANDDAIARAARANITAFDASLTRLQQRLSNIDLLNRDSGAAAAKSDAFNLVASDGSPHHKRLYALTHDSNGAITIRDPQATSDGIVPRSIIAALLVLSTLGFVLALWRKTALPAP